jgi:hypothetical protein
MRISFLIPTTAACFFLAATLLQTAAFSPTFLAQRGGVTAATKTTTATTNIPGNLPFAGSNILHGAASQHSSSSTRLYVSKQEQDVEAKTEMDASESEQEEDEEDEDEENDSAIQERRQALSKIEQEEAEEVEKFVQEVNVLTDEDEADEEQAKFDKDHMGMAIEVAQSA